MPALTRCSSSSGTGGFSLARMTRPTGVHLEHSETAGAVHPAGRERHLGPRRQVAIHQAAKLVVEQQVTGDDQQRLQVRVGAVRPHRAGGPGQPLLDPHRHRVRAGPEMVGDDIRPVVQGHHNAMRPGRGDLVECPVEQGLAQDGQHRLGDVRGQRAQPPSFAARQHHRAQAIGHGAADRTGRRPHSVCVTVRIVACIHNDGQEARNLPGYGYLTLSRRRDIPPPVAAVTGSSLYWVERASDSECLSAAPG